MKNRIRHKRLFSMAAGVLALLLQTVLFAYIWYSSYAMTISVPFWQKGNWVVIGLYAVLLCVFYRMYSALKVGYLRVFDVLWGQLLSHLFLTAVTYVQICLINGWFVSPLPMLKLLAGSIVICILWTFICNNLYVRINPPYQMLAITGGRDADSLVDKMNLRQEKYHIQTVLPVSVGEEKILASLKDYEAVVLCDIPSEIRNRIVKFCFENNIRVYVTPKLTDIIVMGSDKVHLFDSPLLLLRNRGLSMDQRFCKRLLDVTASVLMALVASPILLIIAVAIKAYDGGSILYKQERLGLDGKVFTIYKFRSMCMDSEKNGAQLARQNDNRITPVGKIIRKTHLDELPQIFNVLRGEMSLVGPRPERPEIAEQYKEAIPEFDFRLKVKAGLTGYAQIYGKYNTTPYDKLKLDLFYIMNYSIWLDIKLIFLTVKILFQKDNTEGIGEDQKTALKK